MPNRKISIVLLSLIPCAGFAQSSVTIYGTLDMSVGTASTHPAGGPSRRITQMNPGAGQSSIFGFRGTEDLGGGFAAIFNLEAAIAPDTGVQGSASSFSGTNAPISSSFNRHALVGLRSAQLGTLKLGRTMTPTIQAMVPAVSLTSGGNTGLVSTLVTQGLGNDFFLSNQVRYESPNFNGFSAQAFHALGEVPAGGKGGNSSGVAARYDQGSFNAGLAFHRDRDQLGNAVNWRAVAGAYTFGQFKISGGMNDVSVPAGLQSGSTAVYRDSKMWTLGGQYSATDVISFGLQHFAVKDKASGTQTKLTALDARYRFSKRTAAFALLGRSDSAAIALGATNGFSSSANAKQNAYSVGLNHSF